MNPCYVTQPNTRRRTTPEQIEWDWSSGEVFRVYRFQTDLTVHASRQLIQAGFTHVRVVYQRADLSVAALDIDIAKHLLRITPNVH